MKNLFKIFSMLSLFALAACTDYVQQMKDDHDEWEKEKSKYADWDPYRSSSSGEPVDPATVQMGSLYDARDGEKYNTVTIGSQTWMADNLRYKVDGSYCYDEEESLCLKYGRLYTWTAAVAKLEDECGSGIICDLPSLVRGVCPEGWRMPTTTDFMTLFDAVGGMDVAGRALKSTRVWDGGGYGVDTYGFGALPGGMMMSLSSYDYMGEYAYYWTSTTATYGNSSAISFSSDHDMAEINDWMHRGSGLSIRCIEDETGEAFTESSSSEESGAENSSGSYDGYGWSSSSSDDNGYSSSISDVASVCGDMWCGKDHIYQVYTWGLDAGKDNSGYWFDYTDMGDGGASRLEWPVDRGNEYSVDAFDPVIDECNGLCGKFILDRGTMTYDPFVGVGFNLAGTEDDLADASAWGGICVVYTSEVPITIELGLGSDGDASVGYDVPSVTVPKSITGDVRDYPWHEFEQGGWSVVGKITGEEASTRLVSLKFKFQNEDGMIGNFNIMSVGRYGSCH